MSTCGCAGEHVVVVWVRVTQEGCAGVCTESAGVCDNTGVLCSDVECFSLQNREEDTSQPGAPVISVTASRGLGVTSVTGIEVHFVVLLSHSLFLCVACCMY